MLSPSPYIKVGPSWLCGGRFKSSHGRSVHAASTAYYIHTPTYYYLLYHIVVVVKKTGLQSCGLLRNTYKPPMESNRRF